MAFKCPAELKAAEGLLGPNPDGIIRRGDCLLAVRSNEYSEQHRAWLRQKTKNQSRIKEAKADELRAKVRESGTAVEVTEGYDE